MGMVMISGFSVALRNRVPLRVYMHRDLYMPVALYGEQDTRLVRLGLELAVDDLG